LVSAETLLYNSDQMRDREIFMRLDDQVFSSHAYGRPDSKLWVFCIRLSEYIFPKRGEIIIGVNTVTRYLDDVADGDLEPPQGLTRINYLQRKRDFVTNPGDPQDDIEAYILRCTNLARSSGFDITEELNDFFTYFMFDAERLGTGHVFPQAELDRAYDACIKGTVNGLLKVFGETEEKGDALFVIGKMALTYYTLRDFDADISKGFVNIPLEAMQQYKIDQKDLGGRDSSGVKAWFREQARFGLSLLEQYHKNVKNGSVPLLAQVIASLMYIRSAQVYFEAILADNE
jgi:hypothetical protein